MEKQFKFKVGDIVDWCEDKLATYRIIEMWDVSEYNTSVFFKWGKKVRIKCLEDGFEMQTHERFIELTPAGQVLYGHR